MRKCNIGYGVKVLVDGIAVKYIPEDPYDGTEDSDTNRQTVDAGFWDGNDGEFVEVKLQPHAFHTKDINYLRKLSYKLDNKNLSYQIFLVAFGNRDLIKKKLIRLDLISPCDDKSEFILIGKEDLHDLKRLA